MRLFRIPNFRIRPFVEQLLHKCNTAHFSKLCTECNAWKEIRTKFEYRSCETMEGVDTDPVRSATNK